MHKHQIQLSANKCRQNGADIVQNLGAIMARPTLARGTTSKAAQCLPFFSKNPNQNPRSKKNEDV
jgi:hypothetical protein